MSEQAIRALTDRWKAAEAQADAWATAEDAAGDGANAHAHRKEKRIWRTCREELQAICAEGQPDPSVGDLVRRLQERIDAPEGYAASSLVVVPKDLLREAADALRSKEAQ